MQKKAVAKFFDWLAGQALPLWSNLGVDREIGGFVERLELDGSLIADVRRARLVARQIYAFRTARELGWQGPGEELAKHGLQALLRHHISSENFAIPCYVPATDSSEGGFDLYDQAFILFGLSNAARVQSPVQIEAHAVRIVERMREGWQHPMGGFGESNPIIAPLKANPHMHLLEAALSWMDISGAGIWEELASEIAELCLQRFIAPRTGALHEFFDSGWNIDHSSPHDVVEPGHQSEWAWLLIRWGLRSGSSRHFPVARRLFDIAETSGMHPSQHRLVNELDARLNTKSKLMRLWPQTERIKALVVFAERAETAAEREDLEARLEMAVSGLLDYFDHPIAGSWWEHIAPNGRPVPEAARASSLYHIIGAASELARHTDLQLA